ncbi:MAG: hypothetical protein Aurels2KO_22410 [Aureliella sp.]
MKISFVSFDFGEYCVRNVNALAAQPDVEVQLLIPESQVADVPLELHDCVEPHFFQRPRFRQPLRQLALLRHLLSKIDGFAPDVVHFQGGHLWFNFVLKSLRKYPLVLTVHNPVHHVGDVSSRRTPQWVMNLGYRQALEIIVHGQVLVDQLVSKLGIPREVIHVVPHVAMGGRRPESVSQSSNRILFFGRIWRYKGLEYLIRAQPKITDAFPDAKIVVAGVGEAFERYESLMQNKDAFETHIYKVSDNLREQLFADAAVIVLPYIAATQSGVVPIAFNHSKPVVATDVGALSEIVHDDETGILIPPGDSDAVADAVIRLLGDPGLRERLGAAGKRMLNEKCSEQVVSQRHLDVYKSAIARHRRPKEAV